MNFHTWGKRNVTLIQPPSSPEAMVDSVKLTIRFTASLQILASNPFNSRKKPCESTLYIYHSLNNNHITGNKKTKKICSKTHPWELSRRAIVVPVSTSVARMEQSGDPVSIAENKIHQERKLNEKRETRQYRKHANYHALGWRNGEPYMISYVHSLPAT